MALPASMTTVVSGSNTPTNRNKPFKKGKSEVVGETNDGEKYLKNDQKNLSNERKVEVYDDSGEEIDGSIGDEERGAIDDDEVLRILSLLDGEDSADQNDVIIDDDEEEDEDERLIDPSKQLQQRLKGLYSRRKNARRGSQIGDVVFDVVDNEGRVRDIRKSQLSGPPTPPKVSLFSSPLTEQSKKSNVDTSYSQSAYQSASNKKPGGTVADALEALKNPFLIPPKSRDGPITRDPGVPGIPGGSIVSTNSRLRALATRPVGGSYEGEEVERALRLYELFRAVLLCHAVLVLRNPHFVLPSLVHL